MTLPENSVPSNTWRNKPGHRDVHVYAVIRIKVPGIMADSDDEAIDKALERFDVSRMLNQISVPSKVEHVEDGEENVRYLVDNAADIEYEHSTYYKDGINFGYTEDKR